MEDEISAHRTRSNVRRPSPHPKTIAEIDAVMDDLIQDKD